MASEQESGPAPDPEDEDGLAVRYLEARAKNVRTARALHDNIGPLLAGVGLQLSILRHDCPTSSLPVDGILSGLNEALEQIRSLSRDLNPSPADRLGLRTALMQLAEEDSRISVTYEATAIYARELSNALYEIAVDAIRAAFTAEATQVAVQVTGQSGAIIQISDDGNNSKERSELMRLTVPLAKYSGINIQISSGKSTIVSIIYADRRTISG